MSRALFLLGACLSSIRVWWKDAIGERAAWLIEDLWTGRSKTAWDGPTDEWLAEPRRKIGSSR